MINILFAISTLTTIPIKIKTTVAIEKSTSYFPVAGLIIGIILYIVANFMNWFLPEYFEINSFVVLLTGVALTGALHLDGLADWADGFFGGRGNTARTLEIMKDSATGSFGVVALILLFFAKWIIIKNIFFVHALNSIVSAVIVSRFSMTYLCATYSYARAEQGTGMPYINLTSFRHGFIAFCISIIFVLLVSGAIGIVQLFTGFVGVWIFGMVNYKRLRGVTGDVLGASGELVEVICLAAGLLAQSSQIRNMFPGFLL